MAVIHCLPETALKEGEAEFKEPHWDQS